MPTALHSEAHEVGFVERQHVSCFVSGLKEEVKADTMAVKPSTLTSAIGLAWLYEALKKNSITKVRRQSLGNHASSYNPATHSCQVFNTAENGDGDGVLVEEEGDIGDQL